MQKNIISSITESGLALLYYIAGNYVEHKEMLFGPLEKFNENSFALVQCGYLLVKERLSDKNQNKN